MAVLLTGGAGYIGSHTAVELLERGNEIIIIDNFENSRREVIKRICEITGKRLKCIEADICDKKALETVFEENEIESVVHFAGLKSVGESTLIPLSYYNNNVNALLNILAEMVKHRVNELVFSSSATVYGVPEKSPVKETEETGRCYSPYAWTKFMCERIIEDCCVAHRELSVVVLRYFNPVGAHDSGRLGEDPEGIPNNLMPYITQTATGRFSKLMVNGNDYNTRDGTCVRDYVHVVDLARGHVDALEYASRMRGMDAVNLGTGKGTSVLEMVEAFKAATGVEIKYEIGARRPGDIDEYYADVKKAEVLLGWKAGKTVEDMCRDSYRWQKANPHGYGAR